MNEREATTLYLERSEVRSLLIGHADENTDLTELILHDIDELPIFTVSDLGAVAQQTWSADFATAPTEAYEFFLVRPQGLYRGKPFIPTIVQRFGGEFYTAGNELEPVYFGQNEAAGHPLKTTLEWQHFPSDWCAVSSTDREGK